MERVRARAWAALRSPEAWVAGVRIGAMPLAFALNILLAALLPAADFGHQVVLLSLLGPVSLVCRLGFDHVLLKIVPARLAAGDGRAAVRLIAVGTLATAAMAGLLALALQAGPVRDGVAWLLGLDKALLAEAPWALLIFSFALAPLAAQALRCLQRARMANVLKGAAHPLLCLVLVLAVAALSGPLEVATTLWLVAIAQATTGLVGLAVLVPACRHLARERPAQPSAAPEASVVRLIAELWPTSVLMHVLQQADVWLASALLGPAAAGIYALAVRAATLVGLPLSVHIAVSAPRITGHLQRGLRSELERELRAKTTLGALASAGILLGGLAVLAVLGALHADPRVPLATGLFAIVGMAQLVGVMAGMGWEVLLYAGGQSGSMAARAGLTVTAWALALALWPDPHVLALARGAGIAGGRAFAARQAARLAGIRTTLDLDLLRDRWARLLVASGAARSQDRPAGAGGGEPGP